MTKDAGATGHSQGLDTPRAAAADLGRIADIAARQAKLPDAERSTAADTGLIKLAQYLAGINARTSIWSEITKALVRLLGVQLAAIGERDASGALTLAHWARARGSGGGLETDHRAALEAAVADVLDSGFFTSLRLRFDTPTDQASQIGRSEQPDTPGADDQSGQRDRPDLASPSDQVDQSQQSARHSPSDQPLPPPWELLFLPIMRGNQTTAALLVGEQRAAPFSRQELDFHLAIAGLAAVTAERLIGERELRQHRAHLEELVAQRSGELLETNRRLQAEVTQREHAEIALRAEKDNLLRILEAMDDFVLIIDAERTVIYTNPAIKNALGGSDKRLCHELLNASPSPCPNCKLPAVRRAGMQRTEWNCLKNNRVYDRTMTPLEDAAGQDSQSTLVILRDITERKRAEDEVRQMAYHDILTGLPNRMLFQDRLGIELARAERHGSRLALMMLDLDKFKQVNDTLGHHAGDQLLRQASLRMSAQIRSQDTVARTGGDEFMLILPDLQSPEDASGIAAKLVDAFIPPFELEGTPARVTASIGVALYPDQGREEKTLIEAADRAMYQAKRLGRSGYHLARGLA